MPNLKKHFVIWGDDSEFCRVPRCDVACDDSVSVGDEVVFFWDNVKHTGILYFMDDDVKKCDQKMIALTAEKKTAQRSTSFDAERTRSNRKAKLRTIEKMKQPTQPRQSAAATLKKKKLDAKKKNAELQSQRSNVEGMDLLVNSLDEKKSMPKKKRRSPLDSDNEDDDDDKNDDDSSANNNDHSNGEGTDENEQDTDDDAAERNDQESANAGCEFPGGNSDSDEEFIESKKAKLAREEKSKEKQEQLKKLAAELGMSVVVQDDVILDVKCGGSTSLPSKSASCKEPTPKSSSQSDKVPGYSYVLSTSSKAFVGQMLQFTSKTQACEELSVKAKPDPKDVTTVQCGVFCESEDYVKASSATSATAAARHLLTGVFTAEALTQCTITGLPARGKGKASYAGSQPMPHLCPKAIKAIIGQALLWQQERYLRPRKDAGQVRQALSIKICSLREKTKQVD